MHDDMLTFLGAKPDAPEPSPEETIFPAGSDIAAFLSRRYSAAYTEAHAVVTIGRIIKGVGVFMFFGLIFAGFAISSNQPNSDGQGIYIIAGILFAFLVGIPTYILGILVAAQGQTTLAVLDTAVNGSRHLKDDDVARILSKRWSL